MQKTKNVRYIIIADINKLDLFHTFSTQAVIGSLKSIKSNPRLEYKMTNIDLHYTKNKSSERKRKLRNLLVHLETGSVARNLSIDCSS